MRKALIAGLTVALAAPLAARAQEAPPVEDVPPAPLAAEDIAPRPSTADDAPPVAAEPSLGPQPGDPAPRPPPATAGAKANKKQKMDVAGTAGGAVGGMLAKGAGTAVAGPVGGVAAGFVGNRVGKGAVGLVKRVIGVGDKKEAAKSAPDVATDVTANVPEPVGLSEFTPAPQPTPVAAADPAPVEPND
jgi:hypothetical protein